MDDLDEYRDEPADAMDDYEASYGAKISVSIVVAEDGRAALGISAVDGGANGTRYVDMTHTLQVAAVARPGGGAFPVVVTATTGATVTTNDRSSS